TIRTRPAVDGTRTAAAYHGKRRHRRGIRDGHRLALNAVAAVVIAHPLPLADALPISVRVARGRAGPRTPVPKVPRVARNAAVAIGRRTAVDGTRTAAAYHGKRRHRRGIRDGQRLALNAGAAGVIAHRQRDAVAARRAVRVARRRAGPHTPVPKVPRVARNAAVAIGGCDAVDTAR